MSEGKFSDAELRECLKHLATHVGKFSHPDAECKVVAKPKGRNDGYLRSGNVKNVSDDFMGNAGKEKYAALLGMKGDYSSICQSPSISTSTHSDGKIKQVYVPIGDGKYHLLSVLTPSGVAFELQERLKDLKSKEYAISGLKKISYGGAKPQNIGYLNNKARSFNLLPSASPFIEKRAIRLPSRCFWREMINFKNYRDIFWGFNNKYKQLEHRSNINIKTNRDDWLKTFFDLVIAKAWQIREVEHGWSNRRVHLPEYQKRWLDNKYQKEREAGEHDGDLQRVAEEMAISFIRGYESVVRGEKLDDDFFVKIKDLISIEELR